MEGITFSDQIKNTEQNKALLNQNDPFSNVDSILVNKDKLTADVLDEFVNVSMRVEILMEEFSNYFHGLLIDDDKTEAEKWVGIACTRYGLRHVFEPLFECGMFDLNLQKNLRDLSSRELGTFEVNESSRALILADDTSLQFLLSSCVGMGIASFASVKQCVKKLQLLLIELSNSGEYSSGYEEMLKPIVDHKCRPLINVFDIDAINKHVNNLESRSRQRDNLGIILKQADGMRALAQVSSGIKNSVLGLVDQFPNFKEAIAFYADQISLSALTSTQAFSAPPVLLTGPPGIGKTAFIYALAKTVGVGFEVADMSTMSAGFVLSGNSYKWDNGSQGIVLKSLRDGEFANPFIFLDEVDKAGGDNRYDPCAALHQLLEPKQAEQFVDESIDMPINASKIIWVAAANDLERISKPILSRFLIINIEKPEGDEMVKVIKSVWGSILKENEWGKRFDTELDANVKKELQKHSPREVKRILLQCCGRIASRRELKNGNKYEVTIFDLSCNDVRNKQLGMH